MVAATRSSRQQGGYTPSPSMMTSTRNGKNFPVDMEEERSKTCLPTFGFLRSPEVQRKSHAVIREENAQHVPLLKASEPAGLLLKTGSWEDKTVALTDDDTSPSAGSPRRPANILNLPVPSSRSRRRKQLYEGEQEPQGERGQEAVVNSRAAPPLPADDSVPNMRSFSSGRRGKLYVGEQEPEGTRGQEAAVDQRAGAPPADIPIRNFSSSRPSPDGRKALSTSRKAVSASIPRGSPVSSVLTDERSTFLVPGSLSRHVIPEEEDGMDSWDGSPRVNRNESLLDCTNSSEDLERMKSDLLPTPSPPRQGQRDSLYESTTSSEDLERMRPDLIPSPASSPRRMSRYPEENASRDAGSYMSSRTGGSSQQTMTSAQIESLNAAAVAHVERGEYDEALVAFGTVLQEYIYKNGKRHSLVASTYHNLGMVHSKRASQFMEGTLQQSRCRQLSLECFQAAARTARDSLGKNHPNVAVSLVRIGFLLLQARQYQNAIVTFQEALRIRLEHYGRDVPNGLIANLHNNLGVCYMHLGMYEEGREHLETALQIQRKVLHVKRQENNIAREDLRTCLLEVADTLCNVGGLYLEWIKQQGPDARHAIEAEKAFAEALEIRTTVLGPGHPLVQQVETLHNMARASPLPAPLREESPRQEHVRKSEAHRAVNAARAVPRKQHVVKQQPEPIRKSQAHRMVNAARDNAVQGKQRELGAPPTMVQVEVPSPLSSPLRSPSQRTRAGPAETNVWISPHEVPRLSPKRPERKRIDDFDVGSNPPVLTPSSGSDSSASSSPQVLALNKNESVEVQLREHYPYDAEESCLISDSGGVSERATANFLSMLDKEDSLEEPTRSPAHEIMVVRPYDGNDHLRSPNEGKSASRTTSSWRNAVTRSRSGADPKEVELAKKGHVDSPAVALNPEYSMYAESPQSKSISDDYDDGIAPLGGHWSTSSPAKDEILLRREMLERPDAHLNFIYDAASTYLRRGQFAEALHLFQTILDCQRSMHGELHPDVGAALHNVGIVHLRINRHERALAYFEKAARVRKGSLGKDHHEVAASLVKVGIVYLLLHNYEMALHSFLDALSVRKHSLGALHPATARVYNNIGCVHVEFNELRDARRAFEAALDIQRNALCHEPESGPLMFGTATTLCNLGYLYRYRDMPGKAVMVLKEALELQEAILGKTHSTVLSTMDSLAEACSMSSSCSVALRYYSEILERSHSTGDGESPRQKKADAIILYKMARVHRKQNDKEAELDKLQLALKALRGLTEVPRAANERAKIERLEGRIEQEIERAKEELDKMNFDWI